MSDEESRRPRGGVVGLEPETEYAAVSTVSPSAHLTDTLGDGMLHLGWRGEVSPVPEELPRPRRSSSRR